MKPNKKEFSDSMEGITFISIPASLTGIFLVIVILFLNLAKEKLDYLNSFIWGFVILGIFALFFAYLTFKRKKK